MGAKIRRIRARQQLTEIERLFDAELAAKPQPMQPLVRDEEGVLRFRANRIVSDLLDKATKAKVMDLNSIAQDAAFANKYTREDRQQFAQLIGYRLGPYSELSYVTYAAWRRAKAMPLPGSRKNRETPRPPKSESPPKASDSNIDQFRRVAAAWIGNAAASAMTKEMAKKFGQQMGIIQNHKPARDASHVRPVKRTERRNQP